MKKKSTSQSAFFKFRVVLGVLLCFAAITIVVLAQNRNAPQSGPATAGQPIVRAEYRSVMQVFPRQNPYTEAWLAANHGLYDNIWTAEYETRLQQAAEPVLSDLLNVLTPNYGIDVRVSNGNVLGSNQNEFQIEVNPSNSLNAIGTSNDGQTAGVGIFRTTDGGLTWTSRDASFYGVQAACCDPGNAFGTDGKAYAIILDTSPAATYILRSTDGGGTWAGPSQVSTPDRPNVAVDPSNSNIVYITFTDFNQPAGRIAGYKSTDGGVTWGSEFLIGDPISAPGYQQSSQPRVASNGWIYVGYQEYNSSAAGCAAGVRNEVARSTDGGASWMVTAELDIVQGGACSTAQAGRGIFCINGGGQSFRSRSHPIMGISPTNPSHVYMVYSGGDLESAYTCGGSTGFHGDTLFRRSTDGGTTWTAPAKINTDPQGKDQYYPWMSVLPNGQIWVGWNDRRDDANNFLSKWYQAHSNDEGTTWLDINNAPGNDVVADVQTQPSTFIGDYHGLGAGGNGVGNVLGMWFDSRTSGAGDAYTDPQVPPPLGPTPTATATATPTATATATATPTASATPTATATAGTPTPTPSPSCSPGYTTATASGTITAGGTDIGNHCDDCFTQVNLPFPVNVYGAPQSVAFAGSNGDLQLIATPGDKLFYWAECVPVTPDQGGPFNNTLFPYYDDLRTDETGVCADCGIFTQTLGTAPNRQFVIRWKTTYFNHPGTAEFQVLLTEGSGTLSAIYGTTENQGLEATSGIQQNENVFTSFSCFVNTLTSGLRVNYIPTTCGSPTPTPTATATAQSPTPTATATATATHTPSPTATATATATHTPSPTATATATQTPGPRTTPSPRPRPTPPPRP